MSKRPLEQVHSGDQQYGPSASHTDSGTDTSLAEQPAKRARQEPGSYIAASFEEVPINLSTPAFNGQQPLPAPAGSGMTYEQAKAEAERTGIINPKVGMANMMSIVTLLDDATVRVLLARAAVRDRSGETKAALQKAFDAHIENVGIEIEQHERYGRPYSSPYIQAQAEGFLAKQTGSQSRRAGNMSSAPSMAPQVLSGPAQQGPLRKQQSAALSSGKEKDIDLDQYSGDAWYILNKSSHAKLSSSKQYEAAGDAFEEVAGVVSSIRGHIKPQSSFNSKLSGLETLRKISKMILLTSNTLGHEVRKRFQYDPCISDTMLDILDMMTVDERVRAGQNRQDHKGSLIEKMQWVADEAEGLCIGGFDNMAKVIRLLKGEVEPDQDGQSGEDAEWDDY